MLKHPSYTLTRIRQLVDRLRNRIYSETLPVADLQVVGPVGRISHAEAQELTGFAPCALGTQFRPAWATFWFRAEAKVPAAWTGERVDLLWDSQSEATLWVDGVSVQGLNMTQGDRPDAVLLEQAAGGETLRFQIELACNNKFGQADGGGIDGSDRVISPYYLKQCSLARFNKKAWDLYYDVYVLFSLLDMFDKESSTTDQSWAGHLLAELNRICNVVDDRDESTWEAGRAIAQALYQYGNPGWSYQVSAIGHAHIDTAWLWPLAETHRKCERTFSSQTTYMKDYPNYKFACSQAYQYEVIKQRNPELYARIKHYVAKGQWVPVGGTWIEPDCNIPSGEALARQFLMGQRYFEAEFGIRCKEFWNPDVFGYNGQLPQILQLSGVTRFLTQKLSWNRFNKPHHQTFNWRGIDGSEVFTHFPPADTYNAFGIPGRSTATEMTYLREQLSNHKDDDRCNEGILLYGWGDGGGGPTKQMLEVLERCHNLQGVPKIENRSSDDFFARLEANVTDIPVQWGELYFEYHRATYTSQALIKRNNRKAEVALHDLEFLATALAESSAYPREALTELWRIDLLNQFHDILPGSSITQVYTDSAEQFTEFFATADALLAERLGTAGGSVPTGYVNTLGVHRHDVVTTPDGKLQLVDAAPFADAIPTGPSAPVTITEGATGYTLTNGQLTAILDRAGHLISLVDHSTGREAIDGTANLFELYDDRPTAFDAWDVDPFHLETRTPLPGATTSRILTQDTLRAELHFEHPLTPSSTLRQTVRLDADSLRLEFHTEVDWHEEHRFLKVAFPVNIWAMNATYEMQFGTVERPTHFNTNYDLARFEVPMHRWCDLGEHGYGVALLNDCKYGGSTHGNTMRLSLLRAPVSPDPLCDRGSHSFTYAIQPHQGSWRDAGIVASGLTLNHPLLPTAVTLGATPRYDVNSPYLLIDTVKIAEDSDATVLRLYETAGTRGTAQVTLREPVSAAVYSNILEDDVAPAKLSPDGRTITLPYLPHKIITLKLTK